MGGTVWEIKKEINMQNQIPIQELKKALSNILSTCDKTAKNQIYLAFKLEESKGQQKWLKEILLYIDMLNSESN